MSVRVTQKSQQEVNWWSQDVCMGVKIWNHDNWFWHIGAWGTQFLLQLLQAVPSRKLQKQWFLNAKLKSQMGGCVKQCLFFFQVTGWLDTIRVTNVTSSAAASKLRFAETLRQNAFSIWSVFHLYSRTYNSTCSCFLFRLEHLWVPLVLQTQ